MLRTITNRFEKRIVYLIVGMIILLILGARFYILKVHQETSLSPEYIPTANFLAQNPIPVPAFIGGIDPAPGETLTSGQKVCFQIFPGELMKPGDSYIDLRNYMVGSTSVLINNQPLPFNTSIEVSYPSVSLKVVNGQETGIILFCFTPELKVGIQIAEVMTKDMAGTEYLYEWAFYTK